MMAGMSVHHHLLKYKKHSPLRPQSFGEYLSHLHFLFVSCCFVAILLRNGF